MKDSAIFGQSPNNQDDYWIIKGLERVLRIPDGSIDPSKGFPTQLHPPPDYRFETRGPGILVGVSIAIVLIILITGTRLSLRAFRKDLKWGHDDWLIIPATIGAISWLGCVVGTVTHGGNGKHQWDITYLELYWFYRLAGIAELIFWITVGFIKISIALFNRRLIGLTSARWMVAHNVFLFLLVCYILIALFISLFGCSPPASQYSLIRFGQVTKPVQCLDFNTIGITLSTIHVIFDFALLSVPLIVLYRISMNFSKKIRLAFLFSIGSISCIGSALRQHYQAKHYADFLWDFRLQLDWTIVDLFFAIMAASLQYLTLLSPKNGAWIRKAYPYLVLSAVAPMKARDGLDPTNRSWMRNRIMAEWLWVLHMTSNVRSLHCEKSFYKQRMINIPINFLFLDTFKQATCASEHKISYMIFRYQMQYDWGLSVVGSMRMHIWSYGMLQK